MYGKIFGSMFTGSMCGSGSTSFAVWAYVLANADKTHHIELNPIHLALIIGTKPAEVEAAILAFCKPDERSRTPDKGGRKLTWVSGFTYFVVNRDKYQNIRNEDDRREYMRKYMAERRKKQKGNGKTKEPRDWSKTPTEKDINGAQPPDPESER